MHAKISTKHYAACPACNDPFAFDIQGQAWDCWYCDKCGQGVSGSATKDGILHVNIIPNRKCIPTKDVIILPPQTSPVYFVVPSMRFEGQDEDHKIYFYESHSCPANWLQPECICINNDDDPHGLFKFVNSIDTSEFTDYETLLARLEQSH